MKTLLTALLLISTSAIAQELPQEVPIPFPPTLSIEQARDIVFPEGRWENQRHKPCVRNRGVLDEPPPPQLSDEDFRLYCFAFTWAVKILVDADKLQPHIEDDGTIGLHSVELYD